MTKLKLSGIERESIVDGPGIRYVIFVQGCPHHCEGCHNPQTHDFSGGYEEQSETLLGEIRKNPLLSGVTLSGGEPFCQPAPLAELAQQIHTLGLNIVTYTGYTFEDLLHKAKEHPDILALLRATDILIDGKFEINRKSLNLRFRGSSNQRILDVPASLSCGSPVMLSLD